MVAVVIDGEVRDSKILCPHCGKLVNSGLFYTLHYYGICLEPMPFDYEDCP